MHGCKFCLKSFDLPSESPGSSSCSHLLKCGSYRVNLGQFRSRNRPHTSSTIWFRFNEAESFELTERLSHRSLACIKLLCDLHLDKPIPRFVLTAEDTLEQNLFDLCA